MDPSETQEQAPLQMPDNLPPDRSNDPRNMTGPERRRRIVLLTLLLLILALLAYVAYYYSQNKRLPKLGLVPPNARAVSPPQFLYAFSGEGANQLERPVGVGVGPDRRVYVVDFGNRRVSVFSNAGSFLFSFDAVGGGTLGNPVHLAIKGNEVWVTDRRLKSISVFDLEGKFLRTFEPKGETLSWTPLALSFDKSGALRVTDVGNTEQHRVIYFSVDGSRTAMFGKTVQANRLTDSPGDFFFPNGVAVDNRNNVYIADGNNRRIQVFSSEGKFKKFIDTSGVPRGIAIDQKQRLYVVDALAHNVEIYDVDGRVVTQFGSRGFGPGQFNYPNDVALDARGRIYVTDRENNQVQVWGWPVAALPPIPLPGKPWYWLACLLPLLLLPLLLLRRKIRIVVTPDFIDGLAEVQEIAAVAGKSRIRLVAPLEDRPIYDGRVVEEVTLTDLITFEEHSESDVRSLIEKLKIDQRQAVLLSMTWRAKALGTEDRELRWLAVLAEVRAVDVTEFRTMFLNRETDGSGSSS
jgi:DNA-binding beta-propeller fold protein YncE